jgi:hypothetical protein
MKTIILSFRSAACKMPDGVECDSIFWAFRPCRTAGEAGMNKRILVVEDQEDNRQILRDLLKTVRRRSSPLPGFGLTSFSWTSNCR